MKFIFLLENYNWYYTHHYNANIHFEKKSYGEQINQLLEQQYYQSDSLGNCLKEHNISSNYIIPHCYPLQKSWAKENSILLYLKWFLWKPFRSIKARVFGKTNTFQSIAEETLLAQIKEIKADVVYMHSGIWLEKETIEKIKNNCKLIVLQWSCPIGNWTSFPFDIFDIICTSSSGIQKHFAQKNIITHFLQQAVDKRILLTTTDINERKGNVVFIGSVHPIIHKKRVSILNFLLEHIAIDIYCTENNTNEISTQKIMQHKKGSLGGKEMFETYKKYKIALHIPGDDFLEDAGAKRLFEVTGSGTMLLAFHQESISEYFEIGKELITFKDEEDCLQKINYYLQNTAELEKIADAGRIRTLKEHTFENRANQLLTIINKTVR